jgi:hypothetical protein
MINIRQFAADLLQWAMISSTLFVEELRPRVKSGISNARTVIEPLTVNVILWCTDMLVYAKVYGMYYLTRLFACALVMYMSLERHLTRKYKVLYAGIPDDQSFDLTFAVSYFFRFERETTCGRLKYFLKDIVPKPVHVIDILYHVDNTLYKIRVDLDEEKELQADFDIDYGVINLSRCPSAYNHLDLTPHWHKQMREIKL